MTSSIQAGYQGSTHTKFDPSVLVWRVANKAEELHLQQYKRNRAENVRAKPIKDLQLEGYEKFSSSSLATFNKKITATREGADIPDDAHEVDEIAPMTIQIDMAELDEGADIDDDDGTVLHDDTD